MSASKIRRKWVDAEYNESVNHYVSTACFFGEYLDLTCLICHAMNQLHDCTFTLNTNYFLRTRLLLFR